MQKTAEMELIGRLTNTMDMLWAEMMQLKKSIGVSKEKKDIKSWESMFKIGNKISNKWKSPNTSWELISESRR